MRFEGHIAGRDGMKRTVNIGWMDEEDVVEVAITQLVISSSFQPFDTICPQTGTIGILFNDPDIFSEADITPSDDTSMPVRITREDGQVEFVGYLACTSQTMPYKEDGEAIIYNLQSRLSALDGVQANFVYDNRDGIGSLYDIIRDALLCDDTIYGEDTILVTPIISNKRNKRGELDPSTGKYGIKNSGWENVLEYMQIGLLSLAEENNEKANEYSILTGDAMQPSSSSMYKIPTCKEVLEAIAKQTGMTFIDRGDQVMVMPSRYVYLYQYKRIGDKSLVKNTTVPADPYSGGSGFNIALPTIDSNYDESKNMTIYEESSVSHIPPAGAITFSYNEDVKTFSIDETMMKYKKVNEESEAYYGDEADYEVNYIKEEFISEATSYRSYMYNLLKTGRDNVITLAGTSSLVAKDIEGDVHGGMAIYYTEGLPSRKNEYVRIFEAKIPGKVSYSNGKVSFSFSHSFCHKSGSTLYIFKSLPVESFDLDRVRYNYRIRMYKNGILYSEKGVQVSKDHYPSTIKINFDVSSTEHTQLSFSVDYIHVYDGDVIPYIQVTPFISNIKIEHNMRREGKLITPTFIYRTRMKGAGVSFDMPFAPFNDRKGGLQMGCTHTGGYEELNKFVRDTIATQHRRLKKTLRVKVPMNESLPDLDVRGCGVMHLQYAGETNDYLEGTTEYQLNEIIDPYNE